jgi:hypothetical protein
MRKRAPDRNPNEAPERDRRFALLVAMMIPGERRRRLRGAPFDRQNVAPEVAMSDERPVVTESNKDRIRQGVTGHNVRYVLIVGIALVVIAFVAIAALMRP